MIQIKHDARLVKYIQKEFTGNRLSHRCRCCDSSLRNYEELLKHIDNIHLRSGFYLPSVNRF